MEKQCSWGVKVALYMFLGGIGAGIYTTSFILGFVYGFKQLTVTGLILGPIAVILGLILLLLEAGSPLQSYRLLQGLRTSWMSRGGLMQFLFVLFGFGYVLPEFWIAGWLNSGAGIIIGSIAVILALALATYHGIVLNESKRIPLWSSSALPLLSFFTALYTGLGLLFLISPAYDSAQVVKVVNILAIVAAVLIVGELITIWFFTRATSNIIYTESIRRLRAPIIATTVCQILVLLFLGVTIAKTALFIWSLPVSGVLLLISGFTIRYSILKGGYYLPLRVPDLYIR